MGIQRIQKRRYQIGQATQVAQIPRTARGLYQADRSEEKEKTRELPPLQKKESPGVKEANSGAQHERAKKKAKRLGRNPFQERKGSGTCSARKKNRRVFLTAFMVTLCFLCFVIGILQADYYCRQTGFGDEETLIHRLTGKNGDLLDFLESHSFLKIRVCLQPLESIIFYYKYCYKLEIYETVHSGMVLSRDKCLSLRK